MLCHPVSHTCCSWSPGQNHPNIFRLKGISYRSVGRGCPDWGANVAPGIGTDIYHSVLSVSLSVSLYLPLSLSLSLSPRTYTLTCTHVHAHTHRDRAKERDRERESACTDVCVVLHRFVFLIHVPGRITFLDTPRMSSYLLALAVGRFDSIRAQTENLGSTVNPRASGQNSKYRSRP